jgi:sulfite exporter TauE/SafE
MLSAILAASLLGSLHCVAMCGPLVGLHGGVRTVRLALVHALGRLTTYVTLGLIAGLVGGALDLAGDLAMVQRAATIVAGVVILGWGGLALVRALGQARVPARGRPRGDRFTAGLVQIRTRKPAARAWFIGVLTGFLPCGWLWAFVIAAAGTASAISGGLVLLVFWMGTVPAMTGVLALGGPIVGWLRRRMPAVTALALLVLGLGTLAMRWRDAGASGVERPSCHEAR